MTQFLTDSQVVTILDSTAVKGLDYKKLIVSTFGRVAKDICNLDEVVNSIIQIRTEAFLAHPDLIHKDARLSVYNGRIESELRKLCVGEIQANVKAVVPTKKAPAKRKTENPGYTAVQADTKLTTSAPISGQAIGGISSGTISSGELISGESISSEKTSWDPFGSIRPTTLESKKYTPRKRKGSGNMFDKLFGPELMGEVSGIGIAMSTGQLAIPVQDRYFTFDKKTQAIVDNTSLVMELDLPAFKVPVLASSVEAGDIIEINGDKVFVVGVNAAGDITGKLPLSDEIKRYSLTPVALLGNQRFVAKIQTLEMSQEAGGIGQLLIMSKMFGDKGSSSFGGDNGFDMKNLFMMQAMTGGAGLFGAPAATDGTQAPAGGLFGGAGTNPLLMMSLLGDNDGDSSDMFSKMMMMQVVQGGGIGSLFGTPAAPVTVEETTEN